MVFDQNQPNVKNVRGVSYSDALQMVYQANAVTEQIADVSPDSELKIGDKFAKSTLNGFHKGIKRIEPGKSIPKSPLGGQEEFLEITENFGDRFELPTVENELSRHNLKTEFGALKMQELALRIDAHCLRDLSSNAASVIDDGINNNAGNPLALDQANIEDMVPRALEQIALRNAQKGELCAVVDPTFVRLLTAQTQGRATDFGDSTLTNGFSGRAFRHQGVMFYESTNIPVHFFFDATANPVDGETITINGLEITFKNAVASTGQVAIGANTVETFENLKELLENPTTTPAGGKYIAYNDFADYSSLIKIGYGSQFEVTVTDLGAGAVELELVALGDGLTMVFDSLMSDNMANGSFNSAKRYKEILFMNKGSVSLARPIAPTVQEVNSGSVEDRFSDIVKLQSLFGTKVFSDQTKGIVNVKASL